MNMKLGKMGDLAELMHGDPGIKLFSFSGCIQEEGEAMCHEVEEDAYIG